MPRLPEPAAPAPRQPPEGAAAHALAIGKWLALQSALVPIIGQGGFAALYQRCLHLVQPAHPWLAAAEESRDRALHFEPLRQALSQAESAQAALAQDQLLQTFLDVLGNLIGPSLVERLVGPALVSPSSSPAGQDPLP